MFQLPTPSLGLTVLAACPPTRPFLLLVEPRGASDPTLPLRTVLLGPHHANRIQLLFSARAPRSRTPSGQRRRQPSLWAPGTPLQLSVLRFLHLVPTVNLMQTAQVSDCRGLAWCHSGRSKEMRNFVQYELVQTDDRSLHCVDDVKQE